MATGRAGQMAWSCSPAAGENSVWYDGYENMVTHSTNPADQTCSSHYYYHNGVFYGSEAARTRPRPTVSNVMAHEQLPTDVFFSDFRHQHMGGPRMAMKKKSRALSWREFAASYGDQHQNFTSIGLQRDDLSKNEH